MTSQRGLMAASDIHSVPGSFAAPMPVDLEGTTITELALAVWRRKLWVFVPLIVVLALTYAGLAFVTPRYTSEARILIEDNQTAFTRAGQGGDSRVLLDQEAIASHVQLLQGRDLAASVIGDLNLTDLAEFDPSKKGVSPISRVLIGLGVSRDPGRMTAQERALRVYYDALTVYRVESSRVIAVQFTSPDPALAARIANAIADHYIALQVDARRESTVQAAEWLGDQVGDLRAKVEAAEAKVEDYKNAKGLVRGSSNAPLGSQQLSQLNSQLIVARTQQAEAQARAQTIREVLKSGGNLGAASEVINSPLVQRLLEQQTILSRRIAELSSTLLPQHPRMRELNAELADLKRQILAEAEKVVQTLESDARVASAREAALHSSLESLKREAETASAYEVELRALEREARAQRDLLESLLSRYREASARYNSQALPIEARIVSRGSVTNDPSFPLKGPILAVSAIAMLLLSVGILVSIEIMNAMRPAAAHGPAPQPVQVDPLAAQSSAPRIRAAEPKAVRAVSGPEPAQFPDHVRDIVRKITMRPAHGATTRVLITSPQRQARDNFAALNIARELAATGAKTLLIDGNMRAPRLAHQLRISDTPGLRDLLSGAKSFAEVIRRDPVSRAHVIAAGESQFDPLPLIESGRMERVVEALTGTYRYIIIDTPPAILSPETRLLAELADIAVVVADQLPGAQRLAARARDALIENRPSYFEVVLAPAEVSAAMVVKAPETGLQVA